MAACINYTHMSNSLALVSPTDYPAIWHGNDSALRNTPSIATGYAELDIQLPGAGWPKAAITEIHVERPGIGELQLAIPAAAHLTQSDRGLFIIAPPYQPYAPALTAHGVKLSRTMLIYPKTLAEQISAYEHALQSEKCGIAMLWLDQMNERMSEIALRRLHRAAESRDALTFLFRASRAGSFPQSTLRLHVSRKESNVVVHILKRRGGGIPSPIMLDLHSKLQRRPGLALPDRGEPESETCASPFTSH